MSIAPENTVFIILCFEGPDNYAMAGGLGDRITCLTNTLAEMGFGVHHIFIGDPEMDGIEYRQDGKLVLHRWCQWISESHRSGVYDGESWKLEDYTSSAPLFVVQEIARPAISQGKLVVILGEEWQTAEAMCCIHDLLHVYHLRDRAVMFWNANEIYGFEQIDWEYLSRAATITVVSEYMKQIMLKRSITPVVIPNGIPEALLEEVNKADVAQIREALSTETIFTKVSRRHEDRGWRPAVRAIHNLNKLGEGSKLLAHLAIESDRQKIAHQVNSLGLVMKNINLKVDPQNHYLRSASKQDFTPYLEAISEGAKADILNLLFPIPPSLLRVLYQASDVVLASSGHDPFGLVGMEAIAAGAVVFTSRSAEGHAEHMGNAIVLNNYTAEEIQFYTSHLRIHPEKGEKIRASARQTAEQWTWQEVVRRLLYQLEHQAQAQGIKLPAWA
jgi:hypothetical protein